MPGVKTDTVPAERMVAFLCDPRSYAPRPGRIRLVQTHASWLVLTARRVYKVKKAVDFGFLDFTTLESRRHFCEREILLNRRLCPGVHLGVRPISLRAGRLVFGEGDSIVDYAVEMQRLPERDFMLRRLARGEVKKADVEAVVATLAPFYERQEPTRAISVWGRVAKLKISTDENFRQAGDFLGETIEGPAFAAIRHYTNGFLRRQRALFAARVREGRIRDCHGDLHLEHIHLGRKGLTIYDCIEFNDRFRYIDVANDAAFLAMDFDFCGHPELGTHFAGRLAAALRDPGLLRLLDFYKCYRAFVRGKVESLHACAAGVPAAERCETRARAERYFRLALCYATCGSAPQVLVVMGQVAAGKSTLARALGRELGWAVLSSDRVRKELAGVPLPVRGGAEERRRLYSQTMTARTYAELLRGARAEVRQGRGVVIDATFARRLRRERFRQALRRAGIAFCFVEVRAARATLQRRLASRADAGNEISDARLEDLPALERGYEAPSELAPGERIAVRAVGEPEGRVAAILKALARRQSGGPFL